MVSLPLFMDNPSYFQYASLLRRLHVLALAGLDETEEADLVRDCMDGPWSKLTSEEKDRARGLSIDLFTIGTNNPHQTNQELLDAFNRKFVEAQVARDWAGVLRLMRDGSNPLIPPASAFFRGIFWARLRDFDSSLLFFEEACRLDSSNSEYNLGLIQCLYLAGRTEDSALRIIATAASDKLSISENLLISSIRLLLSYDKAAKSKKAAIDARLALRNATLELKAARRKLKNIQIKANIKRLKAEVTYEKNGKIFANFMMI